MRTLRAGVCAALLSALPGVGRAATGDTGTAGATFLRTEQGARGIGMGGAFTALADDSNALWWNPAGLGRAFASEAMVSHAALFEGIATEYAGALVPVPLLGGGLGASVTYLSIPAITSYDSSKNSLGQITANAYVGGVSFGAALSSAVSVGATAKYVAQKLDTERATGGAFDAGIQYREDLIGLGAAVHNVGPAFRIGNTSSPLPRVIRAGGFYKLRPNILVAGEEEWSSDTDSRFHAGAEWRATPAFTLRGGLQQGPSNAGLTAGFGLVGAFGGSAASWNSNDLGIFQSYARAPEGRSSGVYLVGLDYAFVAGGDLSDIHRISLFVRF